MQIGGQRQARTGENPDQDGQGLRDWRFFRLKNSHFEIMFNKKEKSYYSILLEEEVPYEVESLGRCSSGGYRGSHAGLL